MSAIHGVRNVGEAFATFASDIEKARPEALERITVCGNGFEGWLKFELFMWLCNRGMVPHKHIGLEHKVALKPHKSGTLGPRKQCDLWVASDLQNRYHYVELKAPFANKNSTKMLRYAGWDVWYMSQLDWTSSDVAAATGNAIVVGVGFSEGQWDVGRQVVRETAGIKDNACPAAAGRIGPSILWDVWTRSFGASSE